MVFSDYFLISVVSVFTSFAEPEIKRALKST